jgi:hypothetical protein
MSLLNQGQFNHLSSIHTVWEIDLFQGVEGNISQAVSDRREKRTALGHHGIL